MVMNKEDLHELEHVILWLLVGLALVLSGLALR